MSAAISTPCHCGEEVGERKTETIVGLVSVVDWVGSTMVVKCFSDYVVVVPPETKIFKNDRRIGFSEVNVQDNVTAECYRDSSGTLTATVVNVDLM